MTGELSFDYGVAFRRSRAVAEGRRRGVHTLMRKNKIAQYDGWATFSDPHTLEVALNAGGAEILRFHHCIIATGATTRLLPGTARSERALTYEELVLAERLPASMIVVGGGAIGVEFAYILSAYGVKVTIVEHLDRLLPTEDREVSAELRKRYERVLGMTVLTSTRVHTIEDTGSRARVTVTPTGGATQTLEADAVLQAVGFAPRVEGYGLERLGVALGERGAIGSADGPVVFYGPGGGGTVR